MKKTVISSWLLFFCFSVFGQVVDSAAIREVDSLIQVSRALTGKHDFDKALEVNAVAEKLALEQLGRETAAYGSACNNHGRVLSIKGDYPGAEKWYLQGKDIRAKALGKEHPIYAQSLNNLAVVYWKMGQFEKAEALHLESLAIREKALGKEHPDYAQSLSNLATLYSDMGKYEKAEQIQLEAIGIREKKLGKEHPEYARSLNSLGRIYWELGNYEKAMPLWLEAKDIREKSFGKNHPDYAESLSNLAAIYWEIGDYERVEQLWLEAKTIRENVLGKENREYSQSIDNLASLYFKLGNYKKAESFHLESIAIKEKTIGKSHPDYALSLNNLALVYSATINYDKAVSLHVEAINILEKSVGVTHPNYAMTLNNLGVVYSGMRNHTQAESFFFEAVTIRKKVLGTGHPEYAQSLNNLANEYRLMGNNEKAEPLLLEAKAIWETTLGKNNNDYGKYLKNLARLNWATGHFDAAGSYFLQVTAIDKALLEKATRYLPEQELTSYINQFSAGMNQDFSFVQTQMKNTGASYDNTLFYKGFLLNTASQVNKLALTDSAATENYNDLKSCHRRLAAEYAKPIAQRKNVAELEEKANTLEKELTRSVAGFGEALRQVTWQEVQAALKPGEAAIEFIRFQYFDPNPTDSTLYAALILKPGMKSPAFIGLFEEKQLDVLLASLAGQGSGGLNELYSGQAGQSLYRLLWSPLEPHLADVKTVYYSPAGLLHRLNLYAIPTGKPGESIGKRHSLSALGSTRQLVAALVFAFTRQNHDDGGKATTGEPATATIFGGIRYDMDSTAISASDPDDLNRRRGLTFSQSDSTLRSGTWEYLKYSDKEADNIQSLLQNAGFQTDVHKGYAATEEAFKQLGPSPRILHISTHGFFFPDPKTNPHSAFLNPQSEDPVFKISDHPMIRSGLVLAGANHAWKTGQPLGNREDGILTAYEISQLDLRNTELVVLSACETGLGQIEGNEGVYGLQRAFKIAGAKHLVMSLWQVPDYQTQELMTAFYRNMLEGKMPVRQALHAAQEEMRQKRYEPFYWAGFVLVE